MKSAEHIEQSIRRLHMETGAERHERTRHDLVAVHEQEKEKAQAFRWLNSGTTLMKHRPRRIAAVVTLAVLLIGVFSLAGGSVAFSQAGQAVNSTLARLKEMIGGLRKGEVEPPAPQPATPTGDMNQRPSGTSIRAVMCTARFFRIPAHEQAVWQVLRDQDIELIQASAAPETYYAPLSRDQTGRVEGALTTGPITSPRVIVGENEQGMIGTDAFALAWQPTISSDGTRIESSFSFHDGQTGFEVPNLETEIGGTVLIRVKGITTPDEEVLLLVQVDCP